MNKTIRFYGRDYSPIELDLDSSTITGFDWELSLNEKRNILLYFLDAIKNKTDGLIVNSKGNNSTELYSSLGEDNYYFAGIIGVVSKTINIYKNDFKDTLLENEENEEYEIDITLQIQSRFDVNENKEISKPYFLSTMLSADEPTLNNDFVPTNTEDYLFDFLLLFLFKKRLREAMLKGYYRTYHRFENNDDRLKGAIDISRHIKLNSGLNNGKIAYAFREKSLDNYLNHLIVAAYSYLKKKYFGLVNSAFDNVLDLKAIMNRLTEETHYPKYDLKTIIMKNLNAISHPFYTEYESLRQICLRILRNEGASIFNGKSSDTINGILFYIPDLWEKYLEYFLSSNEYYLFPQRKVELIDYFDDHEYRQQTYPDYVFCIDVKGELPFMILDAKFKERWSSVVFSKGSFSEVLEDYDKCIRDMNSIQGHATGVVFPTNNFLANNPNDYIAHNISCFNKTDKFYTFPIYVPYSNCDYRTWIDAFRNNCKMITNLIKEYINKEKQFSLKCSSLEKQLENLRNA